MPGLAGSLLIRRPSQQGGAPVGRLASGAGLGRGQGETRIGLCRGAHKTAYGASPKAGHAQDRVRGESQPDRRSDEEPARPRARAAREWGASENGTN